MGKKVYEFILTKVMGWKIEIDQPVPDRSVIAVMPHTSYWDGVIGFFALKSLGIPYRTLSAEWLFFWPFKYVMKWLMHGIPVGPHSGNAASAAVKALRSEWKTNIVICPEGTLKPVNKWPTGFITIAKRSNVPIDLTIFNYKDKTIRIVSNNNINGMDNKEIMEYVTEQCKMYAYPKHLHKWKYPVY